MRKHVCRLCATDPLIAVLSFGRLPLANALLDAKALGQTERVYPLDLAFCPTCSLVQITEELPPEALFSDYVYFSSFSDTMLLHAKNLATEIIAGRRLGPDSLVIEAASNDGYLLKNYRAAGIPVLGIEPAHNIAKHAIEVNEIPTRDVFFTTDLARELVKEGLRADVFHAHNVLAHVPDLNGFVAGIAALLKPTGIAVIEVPYVGEMLKGCEFDTIYHEHLCYFSLTALNRCFADNGLSIVDVELVSIHGGSLRLLAGPSATVGEASFRVQAMLQAEQAWGVDTAAPYLAFAKEVLTIRTELRQMLAGMKADGRKIAAYGASAKGSTLLNFCDIGLETIDFVVDRSSVKQGCYTPGNHLLIRPPEVLLEEMPEYTLLLTWNFADEILAQQAEYRKKGGKFIKPIPRPQLI